MKSKISLLICCVFWISSMALTVNIHPFYSWTFDKEFTTLSNDSIVVCKHENVITIIPK